MAQDRSGPKTQKGKKIKQKIPRTETGGLPAKAQDMELCVGANQRSRRWHAGDQGTSRGPDEKHGIRETGLWVWMKLLGGGRWTPSVRKAAKDKLGRIRLHRIKDNPNTKLIGKTARYNKNFASRDSEWIKSWDVKGLFIKNWSRGQK